MESIYVPVRIYKIPIKKLVLWSSAASVSDSLAVTVDHSMNDAYYLQKGNKQGISRILRLRFLKNINTEEKPHFLC